MWTRGKINCSWDNSYKEFNFIRQPLPDEQIKLWRSQGYTNEQFNGLMYDSSNPMPIWTDIVANQVGLSNCGFVIYKMPTGVIMPTHVDHFTKYQKIFQIPFEKIFRAIVFLENWKPGHYFEIDGVPIVNYLAGEFILWSREAPHAAANLGIEDRYTLQITGIKS